ncbi:unnamed protein product, partial [Didymodactylos carnosus]
RSCLYDVDGVNQIDSLIEKGLKKLCKSINNETDRDEIISMINSEYSNKGCLFVVSIIENGIENQYKSVYQHKISNKNKCLVLFKEENLYLALKHDDTIKLNENKKLNLSLNLYLMVSAVAKRKEFFEKRCEKRINSEK